MVVKKKKTRIVERERGVPDEEETESAVLDRLEEIEDRLDRLERGQLPTPEPAEEVKE